MARQTLGGEVTNNFVATTAPDADDDISLGYDIGSRWVDVSADLAYVCVDNADGAAVWTEITAGAAGGIANIVEDLTPQLGGNLDMNGKNVEGVSPTEMAYMIGVSSGIQAQLNAKQASDATLTSIAALGTAGDKMLYSTGVDTWAETALTAFARSILDDVDAAAVRATIGAGTGDGTGDGDALVANPLSQFAATTSLQLKGVISNETGSGALVFGTSPTLVTPALGTPSALVGTNITGTAPNLTVGATTGVEAGADITDETNVAAAGAPIITSGAGAPVSTPTKVGDVYIDTTGDNVYIATDTASSADWDQATGAGGGDMLAANNLSDLADDPTARTNLGVAIGSDVQAYAAALDNVSGTNTGDEVAASLTAAGVIEIATPTEVNTGTDDTRAVSPVGLTAWTGDTAVVTVGTIGTGTWQGTAINQTYLTGQSGTNTGDEAAASVTVAGVIEVATAAETDTGTDATRALSPDGFQDSKRNIRWLSFNLVEAATDCAAATNIAGDFVSPIAGTILQSDTTPFYLYATNSTAGTTGTMVVDISIGGTSIMTTNKLDFDTTEKTTTTAATPPDLTTTSLAVGDIITIDIDSIHTTAAKGLTVYIAVRES